MGALVTLVGDAEGASVGWSVGTYGVKNTWQIVQEVAEGPSKRPIVSIHTSSGVVWSVSKSVH